ncbi:MAG TPA: alpha/beta hydrolase [Candidatus Polarisedimenticolaceae bacterium]|nr:alpha/beta hydrolase [Candidatus Polarisedimenticolaceae bacterium]
MTVPLAIFGCAAGLLALVWVFQRRLMYIPIPRKLPPVETVLPGASEVTFTTDDGLVLGGWYLPAGLASPGPAALVLDGNAGHRGLRAPIATGLRGLGLSVLLFDYRGYAGNPGRPSESGLVVDSRAARRWLEARREVDPKRVLLFGESLGAAVAVALAAEREPAALVLRSPFTSMTEVAGIHYPFLPVRWMLSDRWPSLERAPRLSCPLLVIAGDRDTIVPLEQSRRLFEAAGGSPKRWLELPGAEHNDLELEAGSAVFDAVQRLLVEARVLEGT